jgi:phosphonate transport system substrate-binding protein
MSYIKSSIVIVSVLFCQFFSLSVQGAEKRETKYTFAFVPQQSATVLARRWGPILRYLSEKTGLELIFKTAPKIPVFEQRLQKGEYDFAYMNPAHYVVFNRSPGYQAFAKQKGKQIKGIVVTRKDSSFENLNDLEGLNLAFPAPAAFAASVLPRGYISQQGIDFKPSYVGSHDSVYIGVANGRFPAGGGIQRTFNTVSKKYRDQLRVLWVTNGYTPHAFAAHPRVKQEDVQAVQQALVEMFNDPKAKKLLLKVGFKKGAQPAKNADWDDVRQLGINKLPK